MLVALGVASVEIPTADQTRETDMTFFASNLNRLIASSFGAMLVTIVLTAAATGPAVI